MRTARASFVSMLLLAAAAAAGPDLARHLDAAEAGDLVVVAVDRRLDSDPARGDAFSTELLRSLRAVRASAESLARTVEGLRLGRVPAWVVVGPGRRFVTAFPAGRPDDALRRIDAHRRFAAFLAGTDAKVDPTAAERLVRADVLARWGWFDRVVVEAAPVADDRGALPTERVQAALLVAVAERRLGRIEEAADRLLATHALADGSGLDPMAAPFLDVLLEMTGSGERSAIAAAGRTLEAAVAAGPAPAPAVWLLAWNEVRRGLGREAARRLEDLLESEAAPLWKARAMELLERCPPGPTD